MMLYDYTIKFSGKRLDNDEIVVGDLVRKTSRFGGQYHYIWVDNCSLEEDGEYCLVDFATIEILLEKNENK